MEESLMLKEQSVAVTIVFEECCQCGIPVAMTSTQRRIFKQQGGYWCCVLGHKTGWVKSDNDRLKEELRTAQDKLADRETAITNLHGLLKATETKAQKARQRADNGVCQHCHRSFVNVARHVKTKHPEAVHA
jgi:hypothetical protein